MPFFLPLGGYGTSREVRKTFVSVMEGGDDRWLAGYTPNLLWDFEKTGKIFGDYFNVVIKKETKILFDRKVARYSSFGSVRIPEQILCKWSSSIYKALNLNQR